jgi:cytochrome c biogenesis protein CcdA
VSVTRRRRIEAAAVGVAILAGIALAVLAGDSTALNAVAIMVLGIAFVAGVALVFYEIGLAEDRDREGGWRGPYDRE